MAEMKHVEFLQSPGLITDLPEHRIVDGAWTSVRNARFAHRGVESFAGDRSVFDAAAVSPLWLNAFPPLNNPVWVYATNSKLYTVQDTTHNEITRASGGDYSGIATERWNSCALAGFGFFNNTQDVPQSWSGFGPTTQVLDLANWDSTRRCKVLRSFKNFLIALNLTDSGINRPYRVLWSSPAEPGTLPSSWNSGDPAVDAREIDLSETEDYLVDCLPMGEINIVYKETSTWGMRFIGAPFIFAFWNILEHRGALHRDCVARFPGGHVVATQDDIIIHSGQKESDKSIVDSRVRKWLFSAIDEDNFRNCFMFSYPRKNEIWFCFPESGSTYATLAVVWDWHNSGSLGIRELDSVPFIALGPVGETLATDLAWDPSV